MKLLPCQGHAGLAALLAPERVVEAHNYGLTLAVGRVGAAEAMSGASSVDVVLEVTMLFDPASSGWQGARNASSVNERIFGSPGPATCPAMHSSHMIFPDGANGQKGLLDGCASAVGSASHQACSLDGNPLDPLLASCGDNGSLDANAASWRLTVKNQMTSVRPTASRLTLAATVHGSGASPAPSKGSSLGSPLLHITQLVPWELPVKWHTMKLTVNGNSVPLRAANDCVLVWKVLRPAAPRQHASLIELLLQLPDGGGRGNAAQQDWRVVLSVEVEKQLLTVFDYPPDASRGVDIPAPLAVFLPPAPADALFSGVEAPKGSSFPSLMSSLACGLPVIRSRGRVLLVNLPIPDASMPFNVVCFTSTAVAVSFGSMLGALMTSSEAAAGKKGAQLPGRTMKQRVVRGVVVLALVGAAAVYMDKGLQRQVEGWLNDEAALFLR